MTNTEATAPAAPNAEQALARSDRAILRQLAYAAQAVTATRAKLNANTDTDFVAAYAARVAEAAAKFDTILEIVRATGVAYREPERIAEAAAGNDANLYY